MGTPPPWGRPAVGWPWGLGVSAVGGGVKRTVSGSSGASTETGDTPRGGMGSPPHKTAAAVGCGLPPTLFPKTAKQGPLREGQKMKGEAFTVL